MKKQPPKNRILRHVRVRAGDLVAHELNPRVHSSVQRRALQMLYDEIGFARSLLAYELPDGRLKLIDGHLRASMNPDQEVEVEVLDVDDDEARALLMAIDPLAALAGYQTEALEHLRKITEQDSGAVKSLWDAVEEASRKTKQALAAKAATPLPEQFYILVECADEDEQIELLRRFKQEGLACKPKVA